MLLASVLFWVVTISMRPPEVPSTSRIIPNLVNVSSERAQDDLAKLDLTAKIVIESSSEITEGNVIRTDPEAGVSVEEGSTVTVHVSSGVETVVVPKIEGMGLDDATKALKAAGLELGTVIQRNDKGLAAGTVISASEAAETEVAPDTVVNLVVASGKVTLTDLCLLYTSPSPRD